MRPKNLMITQKQLAMIHKLVSQLGWNDAQYRAWLTDHFVIGSSKNASVGIASKIIERLRLLVEYTGDETRATDKQVGYIKFLWLSVDYEIGNSGSTLLSTFLMRKFNVGLPEHLTRTQAFGAIAAIKRMQCAATAKKRVSQLFTNQTGQQMIFVEAGREQLPVNNKQGYGN